MYTCNCGKEFYKKSSLTSHARFCDNYQKETNSSKYKIKQNLYRCECKREFDSSQSINAHFSHCIIHRNGAQPIDRFKDSRAWNKGQNYDKLMGKKKADEYRKKIRKSTISYIENLKGICRPRYNKNSCIYFDQLSKKMNWDLRHAENGGELYIKELGYFLDAYDIEKNIVVEYDEIKHYKNKKLKEKDLNRQKEIMDFLKCNFYRYNEKDKILIKI